MDLSEYQLVLLRSPASPPGYDEPTRNRIQRAHLAFYDALRADGRVVTNGPVREQADQALRGLAIFTLGSLAQARELAGTDPAVLAGVLDAEAMTWWCPPGTMTAPGRPITIPDPAS